MSTGSPPWESRSLIKKEPPRKDALEVNEAIVEVIALTRGEAMKNNVSVQTQLAEGLPLLQGDRVQLQQVILNLIINAVQAMSGVSEGSRGLLIGTGKDASGRVLVAVQDSGPGLNPESFERLFDSFYTTKPGGTGMGLSICRSIVEAHGGRIWATPNAGPGITVQFTLPINDQATASGMAGASAPEDARRPRYTELGAVPSRTGVHAEHRLRSVRGTSRRFAATQ